MIKLSANLSKKLPIPGKEFSSQQFGASMEIEVSDADKPDAIQARIRELYQLLSNSIDAQISGAQAPVVPSQPTQAQPTQNRNGVAMSPVNRLPATNGNGNGQARRVTATEAQCRAIFGICRAQNLDLGAVLADFGVGDPKDLHVKDASRLID